MDNQIIALITLIVVILVWLDKITWQIAQMSVKLDTIWAFQLRRALVESVTTGIATMNSPLTFNEEVMAYLEPLKPVLREFWDKKGCNLPPTDALLEIEREFGDALLHQVCTPRSMSHGQCLLLAYAVVSGSREINLSL